MKNIAISLVAVLIWVSCLIGLIYSIPSAIGLDVDRLVEIHRQVAKAESEVFMD